MRTLLAVAPAALLLALPAVAGAAPVKLADDQFSVGWLALSGDGALWIGGDERTASGVGSTPLVRGVPGRAPERIATVGSSVSDDVYTSGTLAAGLTASATHAAFSTAGFDTAASKYGFNDPIGTAGKLVDLATKRVTEVSSCDAGGAMAVLDGSLLATSGCRPDALKAVDLAQPVATPIALADGTATVDVAGRKVAWFDGTAYVVRDVDTGAELQRVPATALSGHVQEWHVQADGKLAFALDPGSTDGSFEPAADKVAWTAPGDPQPKVFAQPRAVSSLRIASDRIAFVRGDTVPQLRPHPLTEAVVLDRSGNEHVVARFPRGGAFDFDGARIAFSAGTCDDDQVWTAPADDPATAELTVEHCPVQVISGDTAVDSRGRLRLRIQCPLPEPARPTDACRVAVTARARGRTVARGIIRIKAGKHRLLRMRAPRLLRTRPRRVTVDLRSTLRGALDRTRSVEQPRYPRRR